ncbi:putative pyrroloquinoline-quinone binding quinoprotein [Rhodovulum adriaticum]|uniref:Putative pyrroloquinoline-quinone binding quinoprotein n=1 Tax=Rhodovulum adriaticum TaxID=35804 RepID=A0A4V2SM09_RHOAD|nr:putative pyrroloquinoline-quinone binding quinoprotein [Rhodovulum adriaticum]
MDIAQRFTAHSATQVRGSGVFKPIFILGPGRSYTTIISAMLGQHPQLFGFPELNLSVADTVGQWVAETTHPHRAWMRFGLVRTVAQFLTGNQGEAAVAQAEQWLATRPGMAMTELYGMLAQEIAPRRMVEKSPHMISSAAHLARIDRMAPDAIYLHVTRHPFSAGVSMNKTEWFRLALMLGDRQAYDDRQVPPVFDAQFYWLRSHRRILDFLATIPPERQLRVRGEDVLSDPGQALADICARIGLDSGAQAVERMLHPEESPFACLGPANAPHGNDPDFLENPRVRAYTPPRAPLSGPVPWRNDGATLCPEVIALAQEFGYRDEQPGPKPARPSDPPTWPDAALTSLVTDGPGVPMAHANLLDNSYCELPPMQALTRVDYRPAPAIGWINFGSYTAGDLAVSVFDSRDEPALVATDPRSGETLWQTAPDVLPPSGQSRLRWVSGLLMARLGFADGSQRRCIFAGNAAEIVCLDHTGRVLWRNRSGDAGPPRCIRFTADRCLIFATTPTDPATPGQLVKMDPVTGEIVDRLRLTAEAEVEGRRIRGGYHVYQSIIVAGDHAYVEGMFVPETPQPPQADRFLPTTVMRFRVSGTQDRRIERAEGDVAVAAPVLQRTIGRVGTRRQGGSPSAIRDAQGHPVIVANGFADTPPGAPDEYVLQALRDTGDRLEPLWQFRIRGEEDPKITAAPAIDPLTETYVAATRTTLYLFGNITALTGNPMPDLAVPSLDLLAAPFRQEATAAEVSSPIILSRSKGERGFIAYLGLAAWAPGVAQNYSLLSALRIDVAPYRVTPLWTASTAQSPEGIPIPTARSFAQPALFTHDTDGTPRTGVIMSNMTAGVAIMR